MHACMILNQFHLCNLYHLVTHHKTNFRKNFKEYCTSPTPGRRMAAFVSSEGQFTWRKKNAGKRDSIPPDFDQEKRSQNPVHIYIICIWMYICIYIHIF